MDEIEYIENRLDDQINWYDKKSAINKMWYQRIQIMLLIMAGLVTISGVFDPTKYSWVHYVVPLIGALIVMLTGILGLKRYQENWTAYRTTSETLKHEKFLYLTKCEPYDSSNAFNLLVNRAEALMSKEHSNWTQIAKKEPENNNNN